eukprot:768375-Hanusia_phi.AAC.10
MVELLVLGREILVDVCLLEERRVKAAARAAAVVLLASGAHRLAPLARMEPAARRSPADGAEVATLVPELHALMPVRSGEASLDRMGGQRRLWACGGEVAATHGDWVYARGRVAQGCCIATRRRGEKTTQSVADSRPLECAARITTARPGEGDRTKRRGEAGTNRPENGVGRWCGVPGEKEGCRRREA